MSNSTTPPSPTTDKNLYWPELPPMTLSGAPTEAKFINISKKSLDYKTVLLAYEAKFGERLPGALLKLVSAMLGTKDLFLAMQNAIESNQAMDFSAYARKFFESLVDRPLSAHIPSTPK